MSTETRATSRPSGAEAESSGPSEAPAQGVAAVDQGTYELLRDRLLASARVLRQKAEALNGKRIEVFGSTELRLLSSERIRTENNCVPRDIVAVGDRLLFGYNVFLGLRAETRVADVLSLHRFRIEGEEGNRRFTFEPLAGGDPDDFLAEERFQRDFVETYRYYKETRLQALRRVEGKLLGVFQTGASVSDVRVFRWAVDTACHVTYIDNRGERDHVFPPSHDFEWTETSRDDYVLGKHPHVSILDEVFVETVGGDLTIKVENNTEDGRGIFSEPVDDADQTLADAEIRYAKLGGLILLQVRPYNESARRYFVYNTLNQRVDRIDAIGQSCVQLPEDHGLIFPGGYYLRDGSTKSFELDTASMELKRVVRSPNGEDVLYVFHQRQEGRYVLLPYNLIRKQVQNPIQCHGFSRFEDGLIVVFRADAEPTRVHTMQLWETPFVGDEHAARAPQRGTYLETVGNADLVRGISDALSMAAASESQQPTLAGYEELTRTATRTLDAYPWLGHAEIGDIATEVAAVRATAEQILGAFAKVESQRRRAASAVEEASAEIGALVRGADPDTWKRIDDHVAALAELRAQRGRLATLREVRYVDLARIEELEREVDEAFARISQHTVTFLLGDRALHEYHAGIEQQADAAPGIAKASDLAPAAEKLDQVGAALELLTEVVGGLVIDDATVRTRILERISEVFAQLNRARALVEGRRKELARHEGAAEFAAQFQLFDQQVAGALAIADSPEACDRELARLLVAIEELEGRFGELDETFLERLVTRREDVYEAFSSKKQALQDARQRRADRFWAAAERIFSGIARRTAEISDQDALHAYFAGDAMVAKLREISKQLRELGDPVRADELDSRLKAARQEAGRSLRDRRDLFEDGTDVIRLGRHRFSVNKQTLALTMVPRESGGPAGREVAMAFHLTGTDYYAPIEDPEFGDTRPLWDQLLVSETESVYRSEYLAYSMLVDAERGEGAHDLEVLLAARDGGTLVELVRAYAADRYDEGYERGVHDHDAALVLDALLGVYRAAGLLRFPPRARAMAYLYWAEQRAEDEALRQRWIQRARSLGRLRSAFAHSEAIDGLVGELEGAISGFVERETIPLRPDERRLAGRYLFEELASAQSARIEPRFVLSAEAVALRAALVEHLEAAGSRAALEEELAALGEMTGQRFALAQAWLEAFVAEAAGDRAAAWQPVAWEAAALLVVEEGREAPQRADAAPLGVVRVEGLLGQHPRIRDRALELRLDAFLERLGSFREERVPAFRAFQARRHDLLERERARLRLGEFEPRVMSAFVRNRLIDEVYLPLIGDNLAKQLGALGEGKRTDQMGLLLLISPPGYGKTTLMEYVASRLGMTFVKVNGPALGHSVTSVDPAEATNAAARQEVEKISFALEMGNNVLLYLDDIQHTSSELLQKFIALCDAQRRMEGVWRGRTRTYDLRGKRFAVVMAGNPYTESGETFRIPDMLANRADTYNLGDILSGKDDLFALSYLENSLTANATLAPLASRDPEDLRLLVRRAGGEAVALDALQHPYDAAEIEEILSVLRKLLRLQQVLLAVNRSYIQSASMADAYRTEPPFLLQGSYRNMNKLAERVVPEINDGELESLLDDHYLGEAQALTTGAESNLLKLRELRGVLTPEQRERWDAIRRAYVRQVASGGSEEDPAVRVVRQIGMVGERLEDLGRTIDSAAKARQVESGAALEAQAAVAARQSAGPSATEVAAALEARVRPIVTQLGEALTALAARPVVAAEPPAKKRSAKSAAGDDDAAALGTVALRAQAQQLTNRLDELLERLGDVLSVVAQREAPPAAAAVAAGRADGPAQPSGAVSLEPYLARLDQTLAAMARRPSGVAVTQRLGPGVLDLLDRLAEQVDDALLPLVQGLGRRLDTLRLEDDRGTGDLLDKSLKRLDEMKELVGALRRLDTGRIASDGG
jgi:hypothetical protein